MYVSANKGASVEFNIQRAHLVSSMDMAAYKNNLRSQDDILVIKCVRPIRSFSCLVHLENSYKSFENIETSHKMLLKHEIK